MQIRCNGVHGQLVACMLDGRVAQALLVHVIADINVAGCWCAGRHVCACVAAQDGRMEVLEMRCMRASADRCACSVAASVCWQAAWHVYVCAVSASRGAQPSASWGVHAVRAHA